LGRIISRQRTVVTRKKSGKTKKPNFEKLEGASTSENGKGVVIIAPMTGEKKAKRQKSAE